MRIRRHYQRYEVTDRGLIDGSNTKKAEFRTVDISASGVNIITEALLDEGEIITMDLRISGSLLAFFKKIKGKVVWKHRQGTSYQYGIRFIELKHKDLIELDEYLRVNFGGTVLHYGAYGL